MINRRTKLQFKNLYQYRKMMKNSQRYSTRKVSQLQNFSNSTTSVGHQINQKLNETQALPLQISAKKGLSECHVDNTLSMTL